MMKPNLQYSFMCAGMRYFRFTQGEHERMLVIDKDASGQNQVVVCSVIDQNDASPIRSMDKLAKYTNSTIRPFNYNKRLYKPTQQAMKELDAFYLGINIPSHKRLKCCIQDLSGWSKVRKKLDLEHNLLDRTLNILNVFLNSAPKEWENLISYSEAQSVKSELERWSSVRKNLKIKTKSLKNAIKVLEDHYYVINSIANQ